MVLLTAPLCLTNFEVSMLNSGHRIQIVLLVVKLMVVAVALTNRTPSNGQHYFIKALLTVDTVNYIL